MKKNFFWPEQLLYKGKYPNLQETEKGAKYQQLLGKYKCEMLWHTHQKS